MFQAAPWRRLQWEVAAASEAPSLPTRQPFAPLTAAGAATGAGSSVVSTSSHLLLWCFISPFYQLCRL